MLTMSYKIVKEGFIYRCTGENFDGAAVTSRCAVNGDGEIICSFMTQSGLARNDFMPHLAVSSDAGETWESRGAIWPHLHDAYSINVSIGGSADGTLTLFGSRTPRVQDGESFWCQETLGILQNELVWSCSDDGGRTWDDPHAMSLPLPGAAESPAPICTTASGRWIVPYAPHNTFDPDLNVDLQHIVLMVSDDRGKTWEHRSILRVHEVDSYVAEAYATELSDGRLLATSWHLYRGEGDDYPNIYTLSEDGGETWLDTRSTGILGQSAGLAALPNGEVLFAYNQRRHDKPGVWLARATPAADDFGIITNDVVWQAAIATQHDSTGKSTNWTDFAFGEPAVMLLPDGGALVVFWCIQPDGAGIRFVKLEMC